MTTAITESAQLAAMLTEAHDDAVRVLAGISGDMVAHETSGWRAKDVLGNVVAWEIEMLRSLEAYRRGEGYALPDFDNERYNLADYARRKNQAYDALLAEWAGLRARVAAITLTLTDAQLTDTMTYPWGDTGPVRDLLHDVVGHQAEHVNQILAAAARRRDDRVGWYSRLLNSSYRETVAALNAFGNERVIYPESGWRGKDILAHLYAWDETTQRAFEGYLAGSPRPIADYPGLDAFNQQTYERLKDVPVARLWRRFELVDTALQALALRIGGRRMSDLMTYPLGEQKTVGGLYEEVAEHRNEHLAELRRALGA